MKLTGLIKPSIHGLIEHHTGRNINFTFLNALSRTTCLEVLEDRETAPKHSFETFQYSLTILKTLKSRSSEATSRHDNNPQVHLRQTAFWCSRDRCILLTGLSTCHPLRFTLAPRSATAAQAQTPRARHVQTASLGRLSTMSTLEQELDLLGQSLKRKRSPSSDDLDGQHSTRTLPSRDRFTERRDSVVGSSLEHPIDLDDDSEDAEAGTLAALNLPREIIVIEDSDEDVDISTASVPTDRRWQKRAPEREQVPRPKRKKLSKSERAPKRRMFPVLVMDDPEFLRSKLMVERITRYTFKQTELLREALYPLKTPIIISGRLIKSGNYRLAILGDTVLKTALLDSRFQVEETLQETHLGAQNLMTNRTLARLAEHHGLHNILTPYFPADGPNIHVVATLIEAIIGAVWNDSDKDLTAVKRLLEALYGIRLD
ncbi:unnamed protein product [Zymoseptoria tritici ST99CH_1E4]|uniref:RNase III domain-containing protein n=1 Tax=Zymoseptoria tritici ST99CH_1E4 TaxID=1276532 RepID=A0A2H1GJ10_ZYMTR|nr:unnamed protein product [Zymoseptoria tritici ST99CH_1E4]